MRFAGHHTRKRGIGKGRDACGHAFNASVSDTFDAIHQLTNGRDEMWCSSDAGTVAVLC